MSKYLLVVAWFLYFELMVWWSYSSWEITNFLEFQVVVAFFVGLGLLMYFTTKENPNE